MLNPVFFWVAQVAMFFAGFTAGVLACWWMRQNEEKREYDKKNLAQSEGDYKLVAEAFVDLLCQPRGIESWTKDRMEEVAQGFERIGHPKTAEHLRKGYAVCVKKDVER